MTKQKGIALIPLIFGLLLIIAVPLTINQLQQNQNLQNRAALYTKCLSQGQSDCFITPCCAGLSCNQSICQDTENRPTPSTSVQGQINCQNTKDIYQTYCAGYQITTKPPEIPCSNLLDLINLYCQPSRVSG